MSADQQRNAYAIATAMLLALAGTAAWYFATKNPVQSRADDSTLRDVPDQSSASPGPNPQKRAVPQASIPWKRDSDTFAPVTIASAELPWLRRAGTCVPVYVQTAALPWRY
jgi:hypothetical protein